MQQKNTRRGFTLIELLVVVLIIAILAAVAVSQYQKAVIKSRSMQLIALHQAVSTTQQAYFLLHGSYSANFADLDLSFDFLSSRNRSTLNANSLGSTLYNDVFELYISKTANNIVASWFTSGNYKGCGFRVDEQTHQWFCQEWYYYYKGLPGSFCQKILGAGELVNDSSNVRRYIMYP